MTARLAVPTPAPGCCPVSYRRARAQRPRRARAQRPVGRGLSDVGVTATSLERHESNNHVVYVLAKPPGTRQLTSHLPRGPQTWPDTRRGAGLGGARNDARRLTRGRERPASGPLPATAFSPFWPASATGCRRR